MTDNEIIQALECCSKIGCSNCPFCTPGATGACVKRVMFGAINLINRQKAEIEDLKKILAKKDNIIYYNIGQLKLARDKVKELQEEYNNGN